MKKILILFLIFVLLGSIFASASFEIIEDKEPGFFAKIFNKLFGKEEKQPQFNPTGAVASADWIKVEQEQMRQCSGDYAIICRTKTCHQEILCLSSIRDCEQTYQDCRIVYANPPSCCDEEESTTTTQRCAPCCCKSRRGMEIISDLTCEKIYGGQCIDLRYCQEQQEEDCCCEIPGAAPQIMPEKYCYDRQGRCIDMAECKGEEPQEDIPMEPPKEVCCQLSTGEKMIMTYEDCIRKKGKTINIRECYEEEKPEPEIEVCCITKTKAYITTATRCKELGGKYYRVENCYNRVCCDLRGKFGYTTTMDCFNSGGNIVDNTNCEKSTLEKPTTTVEAPSKETLLTKTSDLKLR